jgi:hypothetical protein
VVGARERVAARLIAVRRPEAIVNERRRQARAVAKKRGSTPSHASLTLLAWNLFITKVPATVWPPQTVALAYSLRWPVGVSREGSLTQSVQVRPRPTDSGLVAREAPGRESQPVKPSDNPSRKGEGAPLQVATCRERRRSLVTRKSGGRAGLLRAKAARAERKESATAVLTGGVSAATWSEGGESNWRSPWCPAKKARRRGLAYNREREMVGMAPGWRIGL